MELTRDKLPKKKPMKIEDMTKEQVRAAILKKRECNAKAQTIVESLLETAITETYFLQCLPDINQSHFDDVIEERCILQLCGYPICSKPLSDKDIPKQKYRISLKTNKVYDITARKSFCSNGCYKSAMHVKKQMLTSPLWFREYEEVPTFHLIPIDTVGSLGQEIDVSLIEKIKIRTANQAFTSINDFASASLNDITGSDTHDLENNTNESKNKKELEDNKTVIDKEEKTEDLKTAETLSTETETLLQRESVSNEIVTSERTGKEQKHISKTEDVINKNETNNEEPKHINKTPKINTKPNPLNIVGNIIERPERKVDPILLSTPEVQPNNEDVINVTNSKDLVLSATKIAKKKSPAVTILTIEVEKCLAEWFTLDTLLFLFGDEKVREMVTDKGECIKEYLNNYARSISYNANTYDQYQQLCKKLNMLELEDRRYDSQTLSREMKPLPDYSIIKEESKKMQLKVKAFFAGETEIPNIKTEDKIVQQDEAPVTQLPLIDKNAQNALRRRIVCEHLNKVLPDLLRSLGLLTLSISSDVRLVVNTFKLKANNIMFKPIQWTLIAIIIIKLLSLRDKRLEYLLGQPTAYQHMQLLLLSYKQDGGYLDRLISWLTDVDRLLDTNDTQLTIE